MSSAPNYEVLCSLTDHSSGSLLVARRGIGGDQDLDARADLFALGAIAQGCLTGTRFSYAEVLARSPSKVEFPPPSERNPEVPPQLDPVLMRAFYPTRDSRYRTMLEFARELERVAGSLIAAVGGAAVWLVDPEWGRRQLDLVRSQLELALPGAVNLAPSTGLDAGFPPGAGATPEFAASVDDGAPASSRGRGRRFSS